MQNEECRIKGGNDPRQRASRRDAAEGARPARPAAPASQPAGRDGAAEQRRFELQPAEDVAGRDRRQPGRAAAQARGRRLRLGQKGVRRPQADELVRADAGGTAGAKGTPEGDGGGDTGGEGVRTRNDTRKKKPETRN